MKLEIGKQYRTRGDWRAVVVAGPNEDKNYTVWHERLEIRYHEEDGNNVLSSGNSAMDLIAEWSEPRKGTFWINIYPSGQGVSYNAKFGADNAPGKDQRIACVEVNWVEGEGL